MSPASSPPPPALTSRPWTPGQTAVPLLFHDGAEDGAAAAAGLQRRAHLLQPTAADPQLLAGLGQLLSRVGQLGTGRVEPLLGAGYLLLQL